MTNNKQQYHTEHKLVKKANRTHQPPTRRRFTITAATALSSNAAVAVPTATTPATKQLFILLETKLLRLIIWRRKQGEKNRYPWGPQARYKGTFPVWGPQARRHGLRPFFATCQISSFRQSRALPAGRYGHKCGICDARLSGRGWPVLC